jgi:hypothetical protein
MRLLAVLSAALLLFTVFCFAQDETLTVTTYLPSPSGAFQDLDVYSNSTYKDPGGSGTSLVAKIDAAGNLHLNATVADFHIRFDDVDRPYAYLQSYNVNPNPTLCANGYKCISILDSNKVLADPTPAPASGYLVCVRAREF